ncbi:hypothetical protein KVR01_004515 [Diaporthe batatas]|uniref:uncharacterized protein n=1 Tax=Diaporthe batatas TaxID=748121 RepID=UPI001D044A71|nr:uncharacterized protein KVR01_004515 [Diaporthe batatas]KAG8165963.1 hypothetical protein KVR01_004515 [Diaporthe batatas]
MALLRRLAITSAVVGGPACYVYAAVTRLEATYPRLQPETASTSALRTASANTYLHPGRHHTPHIDVYSARVPAAVLHEQHDPSSGRRLSPDEAWARLFLRSPVLQLEGKLFGGFSNGTGDVGDHGFHRGQRLLNGVFEVLRVPSEPPSVFRPLAHPEPLLVQWVFPPHLVAFCRTAAADWGYPFRFMSGGRHEFSVGDVDKTGMVEVRFGSAHDYEWADSEGKNQKTIPEWVSRLHRAYTMWLLDERVRALKMQAGKGS